MADLYALCDAADAVILDISVFVKGREGEENPDMPTPERQASRSETFAREGQYIGSVHNTIRLIRLPVAVDGDDPGVTNTPDGIDQKWSALIAALDSAKSLKVQLSGVSSPHFYDLLPTSIAQDTTTRTEHALLLRVGFFAIEAQPFPRGAEVTPTVSGGGD